MIVSGCIVLIVLFVYYFSGPSFSTGLTPRDTKEFLSIYGFSVELHMFKMDTGRYPTTHEGLNALVENIGNEIENWNGPYIDYVIPDDWGRPFLYQCPGLHNKDSYDIWSLGPDGIESDDDIGNWK